MNYFVAVFLLMQVRLSSLLKGSASFVPGLGMLACRGSGGTVSARYCYAVWLRHLIWAEKMGLWANVRTVAELGPGDSLGIGLSALLSGAEEYYALDAKAHATVERNVAMLAEIMELFARREPVPDTAEFPNIYPPVEPVGFPEHILTPAILARTLSQTRVAGIRKALQGEQVGKGIRIQYVAPWRNSSIVPPSSLDMAFSQAVLEHVDDPPAVYDELSRLVKRGGLMSHVIDYKSHGITRDWNGHWTLADAIWTIIRGRRPYLINRWAHSQHVSAISKGGFEVITELKRRAPGLPRPSLATRYRDLTDEDIVCPGSFIQAVRGR